MVGLPKVAFDVSNRTCAVEPVGLYGSSTALIGCLPTIDSVIATLMRWQARSARS